MDALKLATVMSAETKRVSALKSPLGDLPLTRLVVLGEQGKSTSAVAGAAIMAGAARNFSAQWAPVVQAQEKTAIARLQKMVVDSAAPQSVIKGLSSGVIDSMLKSIERDFVRPSHLIGDLSSFINASEIIRANLGLASGFKVATSRPTARPSRTPVHRREEVRRFLRQRHRAALRKLDGIYDALDSVDGTGQSAYSATELMKMVIFSLVTHVEVKRYARETYGTGTLKSHALELIAINYSLDVTILMALTNDGSLADDLQYVKHHEMEMDQHISRAILLELIDRLESLLVFLAQSIDR